MPGLCVCGSRQGGEGGEERGLLYSVGELACKPFPEVSTSNSAPVQTCLSLLSLSLVFSTEHSQEDRHPCGLATVDVRTHQIDRASRTLQPNKRALLGLSPILLLTLLIAHLFRPCSTPQIPNLYKSIVSRGCLYG